LINEDYFIFRGRFPNIFEILNKEKITDSNNTKIKGYKYVYFPDKLSYDKYADLFSNSTIYVVFDSGDFIYSYSNCLIKIKNSFIIVKGKFSIIQLLIRNLYMEILETIFLFFCLLGWL